MCVLLCFYFWSQTNLVLKAVGSKCAVFNPELSSDSWSPDEMPNTNVPQSSPWKVGYFDKDTFKYGLQFEKRKKSPRHFAIQKPQDGAEGERSLFFPLQVSGGGKHWHSFKISPSSQTSGLQVTLTKQMILRRLFSTSDSRLVGVIPAGRANQPGNLRKENQRSRATSCPTI